MIVIHSQLVSCPYHFSNIDLYFYYISGLQIYYLSSTNTDGTDEYCEHLGWKRLQEYNPDQRGWKYLSTIAEGHALQEDDFPFEEELVEEDYYPSLPFIALFLVLRYCLFYYIMTTEKRWKLHLFLGEICLKCFTAV